MRQPRVAILAGDLGRDLTGVAEQKPGDQRTRAGRERRRAAQDRVPQRVRPRQQSDGRAQRDHMGAVEACDGVPPPGARVGLGDTPFEDHSIPRLEHAEPHGIVPGRLGQQDAMLGAHARTDREL